MEIDWANLFGIVIWATLGYLNGRMDGYGKTNKGLITLAIYLTLLIAVIVTAHSFGVK